MPLLLEILNKAFICSLLLFLCAPARAGKDDLSPSVAQLEINAAQKKFDDLAEKVGQIEKSTAQILRVIDKLNKNEKNQFSDEDLKRIKEAYDKFLKSNDKESESEAEVVRRAIDKAGIRRPLELNGFNFGNPRISSDLVEEIDYDEPPKGSAESLLDKIRNCTSFGIFGGADSKDVATLKGESCKQAFRDLTTSIVRQQISEETKNAVSRAQKIKELLAKKQVEFENERNQLKRHMEELDARLLKKSETDKTLTYAILVMIVVLFLLFLTLRFFSPEVQYRMIESRTLVEVVGMAFLLLTVIILGTGEKVDKSSLGTLLGSIAGYIFGQQIGSRRSSSVVTNEKQDTVTPSHNSS